VFILELVGWEKRAKTSRFGSRCLSRGENNIRIVQNYRRQCEPPLALPHGHWQNQTDWD